MGKRKYITKIRVDDPYWARAAMVAHWAAGLIDKQGFTRGNFAANQYGRKTSPLSPEAFLYSLEGSLMAAARKYKMEKDIYIQHITAPLKEWMVGKGIIGPNDRPQTWSDNECDDAQDCINLLRAFAKHMSQKHARWNGYRLPGKKKAA